jgi:hypothetical protein
MAATPAEEIANSQHTKGRADTGRPHHQEADMGSPTGPVPKRDAERRRRNAPSMPTSTVQVSGAVPIPECPADIHPLAAGWYRSLADSGQSKFYEPSDWASALIWATVISKALSLGKPSAQLVSAWQSAATELLTTEGARRRMKLEIERGKSAAPVSDMEAYKRARSG